jgi:hypothetical protein
LIRNGFLLYAPKLIDFELSRGLTEGLQKLNEIEEKILSASQNSDLGIVLAFRLMTVKWLVKGHYYYQAERKAKITEWFIRMEKLKRSNGESVEFENIRRILRFEFNDNQQSERFFIAGTISELLRYDVLMYLWRLRHAEPNERKKYSDKCKEALKNRASGNYVHVADSYIPDASFVGGNFYSSISSSTEMQLRYLRGFWLVSINEYDLAISEYEIVYQKSEQFIRYFALWNILQAHIAKNRIVEARRSYSLLKRITHDLNPDLKKELSVLLGLIDEISITISEAENDISDYKKRNFFAPSEIFKKVSEVKD